MKPILDISEWQGGEWDFDQAAQDIAGVILRCGGTGYGAAHSVYDDSWFNRFYEEFHKRGVPVGAYFYAGAIDDAGVDAEIHLTHEMLAGKEIVLPVYYDVEVPEGDYLNLSVQERTRLARRYIEGVDTLGYVGGLYTYLYYRSRLDLPKLSDHPVWMAQYYHRLEYAGKCELWQYTSGGEIRGYGGRVDLSEVLDESWYYKMIGGGSEIPEPEPTPEPEPKPFKGGYEVNLPNLWIGCESQYVACLQGLLQYHGYSLTYCGGTDGVFGNGTEYAVKAFQKKHDLEVDGVVGEQTWGALFGG